MERLTSSSTASEADSDELADSITMAEEPSAFDLLPQQQRNVQCVTNEEGMFEDCRTVGEWRSQVARIRPIPARRRGQAAGRGSRHRQADRL